MKGDRAFEKAHWKTDKVLWQNSQWAVTTYGIENIAGPYHYFIPASRLDERWSKHMAEKNWVIDGLFNQCLRKALEFYEVTP